MKSKTQPTPSGTTPRLRRLNVCLLSLTCALLSACSGGGGEGNPFATSSLFSSQPVNLTLRPGESDRYQATTSDDFSMYNPGLNRPDTGIVLDTETACDVPANDCKAQPVLAPAEPSPLPRLLATIQHASDQAQPDASYTPVVLMDSTPQATSPVIDFSIAGDGEGRGVLKPSKGLSAALALDSAGEVWSWGEYDNPAASSGSDGITHGLPHRLLGLSSISAVKAGIPFSAALRSDGSVWSWLSLEPAAGRAMAMPVQVPGLSNIIAIELMGDEGYAIRDDGTLWRWQHNADGSIDATSVTQEAGIDSVSAVAAGNRHLLVLRSDGTVWSKGSNLSNQLGDVTIDGTNGTVLHQVQNIANVTQIDAGGEFSLVLTQAGLIYGWGSDSYGQLGGTATETCDNLVTIIPCTTSAERVNELQNVLEIAAGQTFALARLSDGTVWAWGDNRLGQLAGVPGFQSNLPVQVPGLGTAISIRAGGATGMAVQTQDSCSLNGLAAGRIMAWGDNTTGQRGDATGVNWPRPTPVLTLGDDSSCASVLGNRLMIYKSGSGSGTISSSAPGLTCTGNLCWQSVAPGTQVNLTATPDAGSLFTEWRWDCASASPTSQVLLDQVRHCKVLFEKTDTPTRSLQVTRALVISGELIRDSGGSVVSSPAGIDCPGDCTQNYDINTVVNLTPIDDLNYTFMYWEETGCDGGAVLMSENRLCSAIFKPFEPPFTTGLYVVVEGESSGVITENTGGYVTSTPSGITCPGDCSQGYPSGTQVTLTATPVSGYSFAGWSGSGCTTGTITIPTASVQCTARFVENSVTGGNHTLTLTLEGGPGAGEVYSLPTPPELQCINSAEPTTVCTHSFAAGTLVNLVGNAFGGLTLSWTGCDIANTDGCFLTMDSDRQVTATFSP